MIEIIENNYGYFILIIEQIYMYQFLITNKRYIIFVQNDLVNESVSVSS